MLRSTGKMAFFRVDRGRETAVWRAILACRRSRWSCIPGNRISGGMSMSMRWWLAGRCPRAGNGSVRRRAFCFRFGRCRKSFAASSLPVSMTCASPTSSGPRPGNVSSKTFTPTGSMPSNRSAGRKPPCGSAVGGSTRWLARLRRIALCLAPKPPCHSGQHHAKRIHSWQDRSLR